MISIELFGIHRDIAKVDRLHMPITERTFVSDVIEYIRNNYPAIPFDNESVLITVNHEIASMDRLLKSNDVVYILPHIGGG
jgi:molybdopterin converting factor small subunit